MCVCVHVCVREREREREKGGGGEKSESAFMRNVFEISKVETGTMLIFQLEACNSN